MEVDQDSKVAKICVLGDKEMQKVGAALGTQVKRKLPKAINKVVRLMYKVEQYRGKTNKRVFFQKLPKEYKGQFREGRDQKHNCLVVEGDQTPNKLGISYELYQFFN